MTRGLLVLLLTAFCAMNVSGQATPPAPTEARKYFFGPDPGVELIQLESYDRHAQSRVVYTLFADGRFLYQELAADDDVIKSLERAVPFEEVDELVATIVHSGLIESEFDDFGRRYPYVSTSGGTMRFSLTLPSYQGPGQESASPLVKTGDFRLALLKVADAVPAAEDVVALATVVRRIRDMKSTANRSPDEALDGTETNTPV